MAGIAKALSSERTMKNLYTRLFTLTLTVGFLASHLLAQPGLWTQKPDLPGAARTRATGFAIDGKLYTGSGGGTENGNSQDFWAFDVETNTWSQIADLTGVARAMAMAFSVGGNGYVCGGHDGTSGRKDLWSYNPATNTWTQKANLPGVSRYMAIAFSIGTKGYVGMGGHVSGQGFSALNDLWEYDPATNSWAVKASLPTPGRWNAVGFSIGNKGYCSTGMDIQGVRHNDLWEFDPINNTWTQKANLGGAARVGASAFSIAGKGYVGMGSVGGFNFENDLWEYDPATDTWTLKADLGGATRGWAVGMSAADKGFVCTGSLTSELNGPPSTELWAFYPDPAVTCSVDNSSFCADNSSFDVSYSIGATFNAGNVFTAQLSDANGGYANPTAIGAIASTTSGIITASIPLGTPAGGGYRIRVVTSDPVEIGPENAGQLAIAAYVPWYFDADGDEHGDPAISQMACDQPAGYVALVDCDDTDPVVYPGALCDDGDAGTVNDAITNNCICQGIGCLPTQLTTTANPVVSCGAVNLKLNGTSTIAANEVPGANKYQFRFTNIVGQPAYVRNISWPSRSFTLTKWLTNPLKAGRTYNVVVRASFDNGGTWCDYGPSCTVKVSWTPLVPGMEARDMELAWQDVAELLVYPNPTNGDQVRIDLSGADPELTTATLDLTDLFGKRVMTTTLPLQDGELNTVLSLASDLSAGMYLLTINAGEQVFNERLVVTR